MENQNLYTNSNDRYEYNISDDTDNKIYTIEEIEAFRVVKQ